MSNELSPANPHSSSRLFAWVPLLVFVILACIIGITAYFVFNRYQEFVKKEAHETLGAIADLRVNQVAEWREAYKKIAEVMASDSLLAMEVERWLQRGAPLDQGAQRIVQRLKAVQQAYDFQGVFILDERGVVRDLPGTPDAKPPTAYGIQLVIEAMRTRQVILTDLHPGAEPPRVRLDLVVPIFAHGDARDRAIAGIYFRIDPQRYLFPLLQSWPTPSPSAETALIRREGNGIVILNNLRLRDNTASQLRPPANKQKVLVAMMESGKGGVIESNDYRGIPVIRAARKVPDSPWFLVAKMDSEELYAPIRRTGWIAAALTFAFITGAGVVAGLWWRQQRAQFLARQYEEKLRHQALLQRSERQIRLLLESAAEAIYGVNVEGLITFANPACLHMLGYAREDELLGLHAHELFHHSHADGSPYPAEKCRAYEAYLSDQRIHVDDEVFWRKDGSAFSVEYWAHPIHDAGQIKGSVITFMDITERKRTGEALRMSRDLLQSVVETAPVRIFWKDRDSRYLGCNTAFAQDAGFSSPDELIGKTDFDMGWKDHAELYRADDKATMESGSPNLNYEEPQTTPHGNVIWLSTSKVPLRDESHTVIGILGIYQDITERKRYESQLERQANFDELTGLANRNLFQDRLNQALAFSHRHDCGLAVLFIDLDNFKNINDSLGHNAGDVLLTQVASRLAGNVREGDTVARQGGDEFALLLPEIRAEDDVSAITQKLVKAMSAPFDIGGHELHITCSIGIASYPKDGEDRQTLLKNADTAMYRAKEMGRNNAQYYAEEMNVKALERLMLENSLYHALERNEFLLHYQPQVNLRSGEITGMEALVRWQHPELGLVSPARFIPVAEASGLIVPLGEWVLRTACAQNMAWQRAGLKPISVAVNLSPRQFRQPNLVEMVAGILRETGLDPAHLELELTESLVMQNIEETIATLDRLKAMGVKLSIDDFGTGYSSLNYLKRFPIHTLKIDQSFVRDITTDPSDAAIAKTIISMAHELGLTVIAEGVETEEQNSFLRLRHCDEMQGYFFSRPVPAAEFEILLRERRCLQNDETAADLSRRTLLLLDDEASMLSALARLLRQDDYTILMATNADEAFSLLATHRVGVILSDQRMPGMSGTEFLRRAKQLYPETVRMVLSGFTELKSVTDAINEGAVYKFLTKPWDDEQLRDNIQEAFRYYELSRENERLANEVVKANEAVANLQANAREVEVAIL